MSGLSMVTGGCGFLGRALVERLVKKGRSVRVFDICCDREPVEAVEYVMGDLRDPADTDLACDGVDTLYHLAAERFGTNGDLIRDVNIDGTANLLESAALTGVKTLVFASSTAVYGTPPAELPCPEMAPLVSSEPFSLSKIVGEEMCFSMRERTGMKVTAIRPPTILGPGFGDEQVLKWIVDRALNNQPVFILGGGRTRRHYVDVMDCADALIAAADCAEADGMSFNVGFDKAHTDEQFTKSALHAARSFSISIPVPQTVIEIGLKAARAIGRNDLFPEANENIFVDSYYDTSSAKAVLGWRPEKTLPVTLYEFMRWYRRKLMRREMK
ncbi:MAG: NAD(P)-dependent oxidoreductase [bacterium]